MHAESDDDTSLNNEESRSKPETVIKPGFSYAAALKKKAVISAPAQSKISIKQKGVEQKNHTQLSTNNSTVAGEKKLEENNHIEEDAKEEEIEEVILDRWDELMGKDLQMKITSSWAINGKQTACQPQDTVLIDFVGRLAPNREDCEDGEIFQNNKDWWITIGEKQIHPALEMGIRFLKTGQTGCIWTHSKFAFGPAGRQQSGFAKVGVNANVSYSVFIRKVATEKELSDVNFKIKIANSNKTIGNDIFTNEKSHFGQQRALVIYQKTANTMISLFNDDSHQNSREEVKGIMLDCLNNIVVVHLRRKEYKKAKEAAIQVILYDPQNFKGLIRAAKAAMLDPSGTYEEVEAAIEAAEKVDPEHRDLKKLRNEFKQKKQEYRNRTKEMMLNMQKGNNKKETAKQLQGGKAEASKRNLVLTISLGVVIVAMIVAAVYFK